MSATIHRAADRGRTQFEWLDSFHSFSFGDFIDPARRGFRSLRVINDDYIAGGGGFPTHPHRDMEIITIVLDGELEHRDSLGSGAVIRPGEVQHMTAGRGILHSEFNPSKEKPVHLYQIWLFPRERGLSPRYGQKAFDWKTPGKWTLAVSPDGSDGSIAIEQDARLLLAAIDSAHPLTWNNSDRASWLQVLSGEVVVDGATLSAGDAIATEQPAVWSLSSPNSAEVLMFDLK